MIAANPPVGIQLLIEGMTDDRLGEVVSQAVFLGDPQQAGLWRFVQAVE